MYTLHIYTHVLYFLQLRPADAQAVLSDHLQRLQKQQALADKRLSYDKQSFESVVAKLEKRILQHRMQGGEGGGTTGAVAAWFGFGRS
jgi:hypothetical protein